MLLNFFSKNGLWGFYTLPKYQLQYLTGSYPRSGNHTSVIYVRHFGRHCFSVIFSSFTDLFNNAFYC